MVNETQRRLAAILAADVAGYTRLVELDTDGTVAAWKSARDNVIKPLVDKKSGHIIKFTGDGFLVEFPSVQDAVSCAIAMQEQLKSSPLEFRMGINVGDIVDDGGDVHGEGVNIAARLEALAKPGGICVSGDVYNQVRNRIDAEFRDMGEKEIKHVSQPIRVYAIGVAQRSVSGNPVPELPDKPSIAVLPFDNMSGDSEQEYFSDGISEDIITDLSKISGLHVIARNSSFVFKGANVNIKQAATELGVRYVLEGSVRKSGDRVRITAQLIDSSSGGHLWAERYDRVLENIFDLQDEIAGNIVNALRVKISLSEERAIENKPTKNVVAYEFCLHGRSLLRDMTRDAVELAATMFEKAIAIEPHYVQALAGLADCGSMLQFHYQLSETEAKKILAYCKLALEIDPNSSEAHASYGRFLSLKIEEHENAAREFQIAIELSPESFEAHYYFGLMYLMTDDWAEKSVSLMRQAYALAEFDLQAGMMLMTALEGASRHEEGQEIAKQVLRIARIRNQLNPEDETAVYVGGVALYYLNEIDEAISWSEMATSLVTEDSRQIYNLACLLSLLKRTDQSIDMVARALRLGVPETKINWIRCVDPDLVNIRQETRFQDLFS
jgi:adenylate cyclase